ncbi:MAG TPA: TolC family protein, partial [Bacteroidales bacterium]|nr:TolC family protein [Bacteroidales bacterium]
DVDQLELLLSDLEASVANTRNQQVLAYRLLKFRMGMPLDQEVVLGDRLDGMLSSVEAQLLPASAFDPEGHVSFAMVRNQETLNRLDMKRYQSLYLPSLSAFYSYQKTAQRSEFDFTDPDGKWFPTEVVGLQLDIPLWSSGSRRYQVQQARLQLDKSGVLKEQVREGLKLEAANARSGLENAWKIYRNKEKGMETARKIYERTRIRYREGMSSSLELQQTYNQWLQAESDHVLSMLQLFTAKTAFDKANRTY